MFWLHLLQLFLLIWVVIGIAVLISMQKKAERETRAVMDVLVSIIKHLPNTAFEFKTDDKPSFLYGDKPGDFRPMGQQDHERPMCDENDLRR